MMRWTAVLVLCGLVAGLFVWQQQRERAMSACVASGGSWNGPHATCDPAPPRPILQRDLQRS